MATTEGITLDGDGIIRQAWEECAGQLLRYMEAFGGGQYEQYGTARWRPASARSRMFLSQIITHSPHASTRSPLERWLAYAALHLLYRSASGRVDVDRYEAKRKRFEQDIKRQWHMLWTAGLPVVYEPLACPGATHERDAGAWTSAALTTNAGGTSPQRVVDVAITWVDTTNGYVSPAAKGNGESGPSPLLVITIPVNSRVTASIAALTPPTGLSYATSGADGTLRTRKATHWNVYLGLTGGTLYLQNASPIAIATTSYEVQTPSFSGYTLEPGQKPEANLPFEATLQRG